MNLKYPRTFNNHFSSTARHNWNCHRQIREKTVRETGKCTYVYVPQYHRRRVPLRRSARCMSVPLSAASMHIITIRSRRRPASMPLYQQSRSHQALALPPPQDTLRRKRNAPRRPPPKIAPPKTSAGPRSLCMCRFSRHLSIYPPRRQLVTFQEKNK